MQMKMTFKQMVAAGLLVGFVGSADAAIVGFEAESGTLGSEFDPTQADAGASGGLYITIETNSTGTSPVSDAFTAKYDVTLDAGTYDVWIRARIGTNNANDDSFFYAKTSGDAAPAVAGDWHTGNGLSGIGIPTGAGAFGWGKLPGTMTTPGGDVQWEIGGREDGFDIDAFALVSTGQSVTDTELDNAVIPEPGSLALLGLSSLMMIKRRRRGE